MTTIQKTLRGGWEAQDSIPMNAGRVLMVTTRKAGSGGVYTSATSVLPIPDLGTGFSGYSFVLFQDFNKRLGRNTAVRATRDAIARHHAQEMANIAQVLAEANAHYPDKVQS